MHELAVSVINIKYKLSLVFQVQYDCEKAELPVTVHINEARIISMVV